MTLTGLDPRQTIRTLTQHECLELLPAYPDAKPVQFVPRSCSGRSILRLS